MKKIYLGSQLISSLDGDDIAYTMNADGSMKQSVTVALNHANTRLGNLEYSMSNINSNEIAYESSQNGDVLMTVTEKLDELDGRIDSVENNSSGSGSTISVSDDGNGHVTILATGPNVSVTSDGNGNVAITI